MSHSATRYGSMLFAALSVAVLAAACSEGEGTGSTCPQGSTLTYQSFGQQFFANNCLGCHSASGSQSPKFDTVEQIRANASEIDKVAASGPKATNDSMPEGRSVPVEERKKLGEWLACGAP